MKALITLVTLIGLSTGAKADFYNWYNVSTTFFGYGTTSTLANPQMVVRPERGNLFRIAMPKSCGATTISAISVYGRSAFSGQRIPLNAFLQYTESDYSYNYWVYGLNGGNSATVYEIGAYVTTWAYPSCAVNFEVAESFNAVPLPAVDPVFP